MESPWKLDRSNRAIVTKKRYIECIKDGSRPKKNAKPHHHPICYMYGGFIGNNSPMNKQDENHAKLLVNAPLFFLLCEKLTQAIPNSKDYNKIMLAIKELVEEHLEESKSWAV